MGKPAHMFMGIITSWLGLREILFSRSVQRECAVFAAPFSTACCAPGFAAAPGPELLGTTVFAAPHRRKGGRTQSVPRSTIYGWGRNYTIRTVPRTTPPHFMLRVRH
jgi:hypothetical protein